MTRAEIFYQLGKSDKLADIRMGEFYYHADAANYKEGRISDILKNQASKSKNPTGSGSL